MKSEIKRKGIILRTEDGKYLSENDRDWGPSLVATPRLECATVFPDDRWHLDKIEQQWCSRVNVLDRVVVVETITRRLIE